MEQSLKAKNLPVWQFWSYFMILSVLSGLLYFLTEKWVLDAEVYRYSLEGKLPGFQLERILLAKSQVGYWGVAGNMALWSIGTVFLGVWYALGLGLFEYNLSWRQGIEIALEAALIPLLASASKIVWFSMKSAPFSLLDYRDAELLSLQHFFAMQTMPAWLWELLGNFNLFEIAYCGMLAMAIRHFTACTSRESWKIAGFLYGGLWICLLSLNVLKHTILS